MCLGIIGFNLMHWRRMKVALAQRQNWTEADFLASLEELGCAPPVSEFVLQIVRPYYNAGVIPQAHDTFAGFLAIDVEEIEDMVEQAFARLDLPMPTAACPEQVPLLATVGDLALYLNARYQALSSAPKRTGSGAR